MRFARRAGLFAAVLTVVLLAGCPSGVNIGQLQRESGRYMGREVVIRGRVINSFGVLGTGAYEVDDGTGTIWVLSNGYGVAGNGARVGVVGRFVNGVSMGGRSFASAIQQTQRPHYAH